MLQHPTPPPSNALGFALEYGHAHLVPLLTRIWPSPDDIQECLMPALPSSNPAQFVQGAPVLHVPDVEATAAFYRDVLGFTWDFGDETYAVVWRDNSAIHFVRDDGNPSGVHLFQWVKDVDAYHREIVGRGAVVAMEPTDQPYGIRELGIRDVNGVAIVFGQDIDHG